MKVEADFVCEHSMPQPWVTCHECMFLPFEQRPVPPKPKPEPPKPKPAAKRKTSAPAGRSSSAKSPRKARASVAPRPRALPRSIDDTPPELIGDKDLAYEIPDSNVRYHVQGPDKGWLPISTMPTELRERGWVYLKSDDYVVARSRVKGVGYREQRWSHEHPDTTSDVGPGPVLELDGDWEFMSVDVGPDGAVEIRGYQYLATGEDGVVCPASPADV